MVPIRKGDGTTVVPDGIRQVRTGDGRVLFDAIPDSVVEHADYYWPADEGSGSVIRSADDFIENDIDLVGAGWQSIDNHFEWATSYDGVDDYDLSQGQTSISQSTGSFAGWFEFNSLGDFDLFATTDDPSWDINQSDSPIWHLSVRNDELELFTLDGANTSGVGDSIPLTASTWLFIAAARTSTSDFELHVWDRDSKIGSSTGTQDSNTADSRLLCMGGGWQGNAEGLIGERIGSEDGLSESQFAEIWDDTR